MVRYLGVEAEDRGGDVGNDAVDGKFMFSNCVAGDDEVGFETARFEFIDGAILEVVSQNFASGVDSDGVGVGEDDVLVVKFLHDGGEEVGVGKVVGFGEPKEVAGGFFERSLPLEDGFARVGFVENDANFEVGVFGADFGEEFLLDVVLRAISRSVVQNDEFIERVGLVEDGFYAGVKKVFVVVVGDGNGDLLGVLGNSEGSFKMAKVFSERFGSESVEGGDGFAIGERLFETT